jgi:hypothetical protein
MPKGKNIVVNNKKKTEPKVVKDEKVKTNMPVVKPTLVKYGGNKVFEMAFGKQKDGKKYTKSDVEKLIKEQQAELHGLNLKFMVSMKLKRGYRSMKAFSADTTNNIKIDLYGAESEEVDDFAIYFWKTPEKKGGSDKNNDCLFNALMRIVEISNMPEPWNSPAKLKLRLKLKRNEKIHIDRIPEIEKGMKVNINVTGAAVYYTSAGKHPRTANIELNNGHYTPKIAKSRELIKTVCRKQKLAMYYLDGDVATICIGAEYLLREITKDQLYEMMYEDMLGEYAYQPASSAQTLQEEHSEYLRKAEAIYKATNGLIDYSKCQYSHKKAVLNLFYNRTTSLKDPEPLSELENEWISEAFKGGLIFGTPCELQYGITYDCNSAYASVLEKNCFKIPVKPGDFIQIDLLPEVLTYGIYRCIISPSENEDTNKMFKFNHFNKYTHIDIYMARMLNLNIELIVDHEANALLYGSGKCENGSIMFKSTIDYLYQLKKQKLPFAKELLTSLWGSLMERDRIHRVCKEEYNIPEDCTMVDLRPNSKGTYVAYSKSNKYFKLNYARIGPFLTAAVRKMMLSMILPRRDHVFRVHTDSILCDVAQTDIEVTDKIGGWKIEKQGHCIVENSRDVKYYDENGKLITKN